MSLINDALKRATKAQPGPGHPSTPAAPMRPADRHQSTGALPRYFFPLLLCVFCGAFWFVIRGWETHRQQRSGAYAETVTVQAREVPADAPAASISVSVTPQPSVADPTEPKPTPEGRNFSLNADVDAHAPAATTAPTDAPAVAPAPVAVVQPPEPAFRLQGIFYRPTSPSAVVNSKTVFIGDMISGARIKAIDRQSVTIDRNGQTDVLYLK